MILLSFEMGTGDVGLGEAVTCTQGHGFSMSGRTSWLFSTECTQCLEILGGGAAEQGLSSGQPSEQVWHRGQAVEGEGLTLGWRGSNRAAVGAGDGMRVLGLRAEDPRKPGHSLLGAFPLDIAWGTV